MQNKNLASIASTTEGFDRLMGEAVNGDNEALVQILQMFEPEILHLVRFIKMPREDCMQEIMTQFIALIRKGEDKR